MPSGTLCPQCEKPVMSYGQYFKVAEPYKVSRCSHCGIALKRKKSVWLLLGVGASAVALMVVLGSPIIFEGWGVIGATLFLVVVAIVATLALNICGWLFVGWELAAPGIAHATRAKQGSSGEHTDDSNPVQ